MTTPGFRPTHVVPPDGMPAWDAPDPARSTVPLDPLLPVELLERQGDWGHVLCSNGWSAWVDGRLLLAVPQDPPAADAPLARTADPRPLLARAEQALTRYAAAVGELASGALDGEAFRARTRGLRIGVVADGESVWLYDSDHARWVYTDGTRLLPYATDDGPRAETSHAADGGFRAETPDGTPPPPAGQGHVPTRVVTPGGDRDGGGDR
ncbi:hypothetical protein ABZ354_11705 [Streptomyces sp. NPDC005925]|uniref:hypothetical protein n=1 Tax=Streptomyces sp. NPDC005925 TaxID=3157172 RepID=UPI0033D6ED54